MPVKKPDSLCKQVMAWARDHASPFSGLDAVSALRMRGCNSAEISIRSTVSILVSRGSLDVVVHQNGGRKNRFAMYSARVSEAGVGEVCL